MLDGMDFMPLDGPPGGDDTGPHRPGDLYVRERKPTAVGQEDPSAAPSAAIVPQGPGPLTAPSARRAAGVSLLIAAGGAAVGAMVGGVWGAGAGLLAAGALRNGARAKKLWGSADQTERDEAASSVTMAIVGGASAGYLGYRAYQDRRLE